MAANKLAVLRRGLHLVPVDDDGREIVRKLRPGVAVMVEVSRNRSVPQHRLAMGLFRKVWERLPADGKLTWPRMENLRDAILEAVGYCEEYATLDGEIRRQARSVAFDKMDHGEFSAFLEMAVRLLCEKVIPDIDDQALLDEVEDMVAR